MRQLRLPIWQFVRIMVQLEPRAGKSPVGVYAHWRSAWQEVDRELSRLGKSDAAGFATLMMEHEVDLNLRNDKDLSDVIKALDEVVVAMSREQRAAVADKSRRKDLQFEIDELRTLRASLGGGTKSQAPKRRPVASSSRTAPKRSPRRR